MIKTINTYFVRQRADIAKTLFNHGGTANGHYKAYRRKIHFYNLQGDFFAALIINANQSPFFVSASIQSGKPLYMFGLKDGDKETLGLPDSYAAERLTAQSITDDIRAAQ